MQLSSATNVSQQLQLAIYCYIQCSYFHAVPIPKSLPQLPYTAHANRAISFIATVAIGQLVSYVAILKSCRHLYFGPALSYFVPLAGHRLSTVIGIFSQPVVSRIGCTGPTCFGLALGSTGKVLFVRLHWKGLFRISRRLIALGQYRAIGLDQPSQAIMKIKI